MIVLGLLLVLVAVGGGVIAVIAPTSTARVVELTALGVTVSASPLAMFTAGAVSVVLLGVGFALISRGTRRKAASRKELRRLRKEQSAAGASTSAVAGERTSRRDERHGDGDKDSDKDSGQGSGAEGSHQDAANSSSGADSEDLPGR